MTIFVRACTGEYTTKLRNHASIGLKVLVVAGPVLDFLDITNYAVTVYSAVYLPYAGWVEALVVQLY